MVSRFLFLPAVALRRLTAGRPAREDMCTHTQRCAVHTCVLKVYRIICVICGSDFCVTENVCRYSSSHMHRFNLAHMPCRII